MAKVNFVNLTTEKEIKKRFKFRIIREIFDYTRYFLKVFIIIVFCYLLVKDNVFDHFIVSGDSMYPNYKNKEIVYINKLTPKFSDYKRGEVVIINMPEDQCKSHVEATGCYYIKRIIGLPGERIMLKEGDVYIINKDYPKGVKLDENGYLDQGLETYRYSNRKSDDDVNGYYSAVLKNNEYYVIGDNRSISVDSRVFGPVVKGDVEGKVFFRSEDGFFDLPSYNIPNE